MKKLSITNHTLVPRHAKVSDKEKQELFKTYNISPEKLPRILKDDPALLNVGVKEGDVVKISRQSATAGTAIYYRVVVDD